MPPRTPAFANLTVMDGYDATMSSANQDQRVKKNITYLVGDMQSKCSIPDSGLTIANLTSVVAGDAEWCDHVFKYLKSDQIKHKAFREATWAGTDGEVMTKNLAEACVRQAYESSLRETHPPTRPRRTGKGRPFSQVTEYESWVRNTAREYIAFLKAGRQASPNSQPWGQRPVASAGASAATSSSEASLPRATASQLIGNTPTEYREDEQGGEFFFSGNGEFQSGWYARPPGDPSRQYDEPPSD